MATVDIIIRMIDQTGGVSNKTVANMKNMAASAATVAAAFVGVGLAAKKAFDLGKEGAQLEFTKVKFDRLATSIGTTSDALLGDLKTATRGMYSDMELIASATDFVALGLAKTHDEAIRLSTVSAGLNMNMNQLVLTLTNMTTMRFDALGVRVDGFKEKVKELEAAGYSADAAFKEAFLQQAEQQLETVGNAADTSAGQFMKFEAEWKNATDSIKIGVSQAFLPAIESWNNMVDRAQSYTDMLHDVAKANGMTWEEFIRLGDGIEELTNDYVRASQAGAGWEKILGNQTAQTAAAVVTQAQFNEKMSYLSDIMSTDLSDAQEQYNEKIGELKKLYEEANTEADKQDILGKIQSETEAYNERASAIMFNIQQQAILAGVEAGKIDAGAAADVLSELAGSYGLIDEKQQAALDRTNELIARFAETGDIEEFTQSLRDQEQWTQELTGAQLQLGEKIKATSQRSLDARDPILAANEAFQAMAETLMSQANPALTGINSELDSLPPSGTSWQYYFNITTTGSVPRVGEAVGGGGGAAETAPLGAGDSNCFIAGTRIAMGDGSYKSIEDVVIGDVVMSYDETGEAVVPMTVQKTFVHDAPMYLYINNHLGVTPEHLIFYNGEWGAAGNLKIGDVLVRLDGGFESVESIVPVMKAVKVYNFEVNGDPHTYFANDILVHNAKWSGGWLPTSGGTFVGDAPGGALTPYTEFITASGYVIPASETKRLVSMGLINGKGMARGGKIGLSFPTGDWTPGAESKISSGKPSVGSSRKASPSDMQSSESVKANKQMSTFTPEESANETAVATQQMVQAQTLASNKIVEKLDELGNTITNGFDRSSSRIAASSVKREMR